jgi:hypothetical protein
MKFPNTHILASIALRFLHTIWLGSFRFIMSHDTTELPVLSQFSGLPLNYAILTSHFRITLLAHCDQNIPPESVYRYSLKAMTSMAGFSGAAMNTNGEFQAVFLALHTTSPPPAFLRFT